MRQEGEEAVRSHSQEAERKRAVGALLTFLFLCTVGAQLWDGTDNAEDGSSPMG